MPKLLTQLSKMLRAQWTHPVRLVMATLGALFIVPLLLIAPQISIHYPQAEAQSPQRIKAQEEEIRQQMIVMSRHLGVTCTTCHKTENFQSDEIPAFKVAKAHIKLTQALIDNGFDGSAKDRPKADCYMCHRGQLMPDYKERLDPMRKESTKKSEAAPAATEKTKK
jgi:hypothetical protein